MQQISARLFATAANAAVVGRNPATDVTNPATINPNICRDWSSGSRQLIGAVDVNQSKRSLPRTTGLNGQ